MHHTILNYHVKSHAHVQVIADLRSWCEDIVNQCDFLDVTLGSTQHYAISLREVIGQNHQCEQRLLAEFGDYLELYTQD